MGKERKGNWIYVDSLIRGREEEYRIILPDGKRIDYKLTRLEDRYTIRMSDEKNSWVMEFPTSTKRKRELNVSRKRLRKFVDNRLVKLAGEYRTGSYNRTYNLR